MYLNPLDRHNLKSISNRNKLSLFELAEANGQESILANILHKNLEEQKSTVILVPSEQEASTLLTYLSNLKLDTLALSVTDNKPIDARALSVLRSAIKNNSNTSDNHEFELLKINAENSIAELQKCYEYLDIKIFGERSWRALSDQSEYFNYDAHVQLMKRDFDNTTLQFTQKEYWFLRGRIEVGSEQYIEYFDVLDDINLLNPVLFQDERDFEISYKNLLKFKQEGEALLNSFGACLAEISETFKKQGLEELDQLNAMHAAMKQSMLEYEKRFQNSEEKPTGIGNKLIGAFSSKENKKNEAQKIIHQQLQFLISEFNNSEYFSFDVLKLNTDDFNIKQCKDILSQTGKLVDQWQSSIEIYKGKKLKQLSFLNSEHPKVHDLEAKLKTYILKINQSKLLYNTLEDNAFSMYNKIETLESFLIDLKKSLFIIENNPQYIEWKRLLSFGSGTVQQVIGALKSFPTKQWTRIFDQYYIGEILDRHYNPKMPKNNMQIEHIAETTHRYRELSIDAIKQKWNLHKNKQLKELKNHNKELYTALVKKNTLIDLTWGKMLSNNPDFITSVFPIIILQEKVVSKAKPLYYKWDDCIIYNWSKFNEIVSLQLRALSSSQLIIEEEIISDQLEKQIRSYYDSSQLYKERLSGDHLGNVPLKIKDLNNAEKIRVSKSLAKMLLDIQPNTRLLFLKNHNIISTLTNKRNQQLKLTLDHLGIKRITS